MHWPQPPTTSPRPVGNLTVPGDGKCDCLINSTAPKLAEPNGAVLPNGASSASGLRKEARSTRPNADAFVMIPQGIEGPAFLVTKNFLAIMDYNFSHSYALAVGHLADRIRGGAAIQSAWPAVNTSLSFAQRVEIQRRLTARGFETGGSDGRFGARTYEAIIAFQKSAGLPLDGEPTEKLLDQLRRGG